MFSAVSVASVLRRVVPALLIRRLRPALPTSSRTFPTAALMLLGSVTSAQGQEGLGIGWGTRWEADPSHQASSWAWQ